MTVHRYTQHIDIYVINNLATQKNIIEVEVINSESIENYQNEIANLEMHNKLDTNINRNLNYNYEIIATLLQNAKK